MSLIDSGVYKITNSLNGKVYIGSSINMSKRCKQHFYALNNDVHKSVKLQNSFNKYGESAHVFSRLLICNKKDMLMYEQRAIDIFESVKYGFNIAPKAGNTLGIKRGSVTKNKLSIIATNQWMDSDHRDKVSSGHAKYWTQSKRDEQSKRASKQERSQLTKDKISESGKKRFNIAENFTKQCEILSAIKSNPEQESKRINAIRLALSKPEYRLKKSIEMKLLWEKRRKGDAAMYISRVGEIC